MTLSDWLQELEDRKASILAAFDDHYITYNEAVKLLTDDYYGG